MDQIPEIEVQDIQAVARLSHRDKRKEPEKLRDQVVPRQTQNGQRKQRHHQPIVHHDVRKVVAEIQHSIDAHHPQRAQQQPPARGPGNERIQIRQHNPKQERRDVRRRREFQRAHPETIGIASWMHIPIRMQAHV